MANLPFVKVYCSAEFRDQMAELAQLTRKSISDLVRGLLEEEIDIEKRLHIARAAESSRLAMLQAVKASQAGQTDWLSQANGSAPGGAHAAARRGRPRTSGKGKSRLKSRQKRSEKRGRRGGR